MQKAGLSWQDVDDIVLAGGASRMPMVPKLLSKVTGRQIGKAANGFDMDTAISQGAALYSIMQKDVHDVVSRSVGVEVQQAGRKLVEVLIQKNTSLPSEASRTFQAQENAVLKVYEGESLVPEECILRGKLSLQNPAGEAMVTLKAHKNGTLHAFVLASGKTSELKIESASGQSTDIQDLKERIRNIPIR
jgi:molecular chaperone DnaK